jgi:hypothetical protein
MRRFLALLFAVMALSLGACGTPSGQSPSDSKNEGKSAASLTPPQ